MSKQTFSNDIDMSCTEKCKYRKHGNLITSAITNSGISDYQIACYINKICRNYSQVSDDDGRNALHVAASCGRKDLCLWLIKTGRGDFNLKDQESGYTALHRSVYYGHINNTVAFIKMGAQVQLTDKDDLQASDHAMKDRLIKELSLHSPCQVYVWGSNNNYTLGTGNQQSRSNPELLDFFKKNNISIKQVAIDKFHSVFVSSKGRAWACGHGQGGRLGLETEQTVLKPQAMRTGAEVVVAASVGRNHTILLMDSGEVWTCGSNTHHVLGHNPPPATLLVPRAIPSKILSKCNIGKIIGVAAARYHSVLWSTNGVLTCGLNGGQLGHALQGNTIVTPKQVPGLSYLSQGKPEAVMCKIVDLATSIGATVVSISKGDIYVLHNYQVRRIASRILDIFKVAVFGGELNSDLDQKLSSKGGEELRVMVLTTTGNVLLWQESFPQLTRCYYTLKRSLRFCGMTLCQSSALLITSEGEAYFAHVKPKAKKKTAVVSQKTEGMTFNQFIERLDCHHMSITRIAHIHRAVAVTADPKGRNFVVIQEHPTVNLTDIPLLDESEFFQQMASLLKDAHEDDSLHDILLEIDKSLVPVHQLVLARSSEMFASMPRSGSVRTVKLDDVHPQVLNQILLFAYTDDCDILHPGPLRINYSKGDIIKAAFDLAKRLKMPVLMKCLQLLKFEDGLIMLKEGDCDILKETLRKQTEYERSMFSFLYNTTIVSSDGASFKAHKCILAARLEYFNSMFTGGWVEADVSSSFSLPFPQTILCEVLDFLYRDKAPKLMESQDIDFISSVLVVADQLLIKRLKQICEVALSGNITLRNAAYILQLAITCNADQLKHSCLQFIGLNLAAMLETRILEILEDKTLEELSRYYRDMIPAVSHRKITPYSTSEPEEEIIEIAHAYPVPWTALEDASSDVESTPFKGNRTNPIPITAKRKTPRTRRTSESLRKRLDSLSSSSDFDCSVDHTPPDRLDFENLIEIDQLNQEEQWVKVDKSQKTVQNRLKVLVTAPKVQPTPEDFTKLISSSSAPLQDIKNFPELSAQGKLGSSPKSCTIEIKWSPVAKLSQKQRKKLLSEGEGKEESPPESVRSPWAPINHNIDCSLANIMRSTLVAKSPPSSQVEQGTSLRFADIMADEIQQRDNWSRMKSKSFQLTQIEDKAIEELRIFYNASNIVDERISVERVLQANIAKPTWITSRNNKICT